MLLPAAHSYESTDCYHQLILLYKKKRGIPDNWNEIQLMIKEITYKNNIKPTLKYYVIHSAQILMTRNGVCDRISCNAIFLLYIEKFLLLQPNFLVLFCNISLAYLKYYIYSYTRSVFTEYTFLKSGFV